MATTSTRAPTYVSGGKRTCSVKQGNLNLLTVAPPGGQQQQNGENHDSCSGQDSNGTKF